MPRLVSLFALLATVVLVGLLFFQVIASFVLPLFLALVLVVIFRPMYRWFVARCKGHERIAAVVTTVAVALIVLVPTLGILTFAGVEAASVVASLNDARMRETLERLRGQWGLNMPATLRPVEEAAERLELAPATSGQFASMQSAARELRDAIQRLAMDWNLLDGPNRTPEDANLALLLKEYNEQLEELAALNRDNPSWESALSVVRDAYFDRVRPALLHKALSGAYGRIKIWAIQQANPGRSELAALRAHAQDWLSSDALGPLAATTGRKLGSFLIGLVVMLVALYYFFADGPGMTSTAIRLAPLEKTYVEQLVSEFDKVSRAVVVATLLAAVAQGMLAGVGYWLAGLQSVFLLMILTAVLAMIPFVGATSVWLPCCLWLLFVEQRTLPAALLAIYGVAIVSSVDNVIKPLVLHGQSNIHPLLALLSVLGGVRAMGPIGIFVGPMAVAFLQALLNMLQTELKAMGDQGAFSKKQLAHNPPGGKL